MNEQKSIIWKWAAGLLALCNIALIATIWLKPEQAAYDPRRETPRDFVIRNLNLSDSQVKSYDVLIAAHQEAMHRLRRHAMSNRQYIFAGLQTNVNDNVTDSLATAIAGTQKEMELITYHHFAQVRALCTADQQPKFDRIIGDVIKKMNSMPPPPGDKNAPPGRPGDEHMPPGENGHGRP